MKNKITLLAGLALMVLAGNAFAQDPTAAPPITPATPPPAITPAATPTPVATATANAKEDLEARIERKVKHGLHVSVGPDRVEHRAHHDSDGDDLGALIAIPIVAIIFGTLFLAPVMIVAAILFFNFLRQRSLHRTVRMMVEKGQPVPAALFSAPPVVRARSDMRRGVVLTMIGIGLIMFFGAVSDWDGGVWTLGLIPFLMGAGYLTVWKLEGHKTGATASNSGTDNHPPLA